MGACGCGDYTPSFKFSGPDGVVYALEFYTGCEYCETGPGITIHRHGEQGRRDWGVDTLPELLFHELDGVEAQAAIPILSWEAAKKRFVPLARGSEDEDDAMAQIIVGDILERGLRFAVGDTLDEWTQNVLKAKG